jgi:hypothetical protein
MPSTSEDEGSTRLLEGVHCLHIEKLRSQTLVLWEILVFTFKNMALNVEILRSTGKDILNKVL